MSVVRNSAAYIAALQYVDPRTQEVIPFLRTLEVWKSVCGDIVAKRIETTLGTLRK